MLQCEKEIIFYTVTLYNDEDKPHDDKLTTIHGILYAKDMKEAGVEIDCEYGALVESVKFQRCGFGLFEIPEGIDINHLMMGRMF